MRCCATHPAPRRCGAGRCRRRSSCRCRTCRCRWSRPVRPAAGTGARPPPPGTVSPDSTSSASSSCHSWRNRLAPVRLPSPPITTSESMPRSTMFLAARRRPSLVRKVLDLAVPIDGAALLQDPGDVRGLHPADQVAALGQALVALVDGVDVDAVVQCGPHDGPDGRVHAGGVAAAGEDADAGGRVCLPGSFVESRLLPGSLQAERIDLAHIRTSADPVPTGWGFARRRAGRLPSPA